MTHLHYSESGSGERLILLHGLFGSGVNLRGLSRRLSATHRVVMADLRNHGRSPHVAGMTYVDMAKDLGGLLDELGLTAADFVGHSMGGKAAMWLALTRPQRVRRLVVVDIAPVAYRHSHRDLVEALGALDLAALTSRGAADQALAPAVPDTVVRSFLLQNLVVENTGLRWRINLDAISAHIGEVAGFPESIDRSYSGPALFVAGGQSGYISDAHRPEIERLFPSAQVVHISGAGHWVHVDRPDALTEVIREFLPPVSAPQ